MKRVARYVVPVCLAAVALVASCASPDPGALAREQRRQAALRIAQAHALVQGQRYDAAIDAFVQLAAEKSVQAEAVDGASEAVVRKASAQRVPDRLETVRDVGKRLPATELSRTAMRAAITTLLVEPVVEEARQAGVLLENRRAFVEQMRDDGEGDVMPTPEDRAMTGQEALRVRQRLPELGVSESVEKLYRYARPLAALMDRFAVDDQRYLAQTDVSEDDLDEIERSCDMLERMLAPVQRQLDVVRPGWRRQP